MLFPTCSKLFKSMLSLVWKIVEMKSLSLAPHSQGINIEPSCFLSLLAISLKPRSYCSFYLTNKYLHPVSFEAYQQKAKYNILFYQKEGSMMQGC